MAEMKETRRWPLIALLLCAACGGGQRVRSPRVQPGWYVVQFTNARLEARRPDGRPWHTTASDNTAVLIGGLIGLAAGYPGLGLSLGEAASDPGGDPLAPAPFIDLKMEGETYRVSPAGRTYAPNWRQPIVIDARRRRSSDRVIVQLRDAVDDSAIAQQETTLGELLGRPAQTFTKLGAVMSIDVTASQVPARKLAEYRVVVPATIRFNDLTREGAPGWRPIPVWNGDTVEIEARGQVCPSSRSECFDANGAQPGRWTGYSYFKSAPHASLVAAVPGEEIHVGIHRSFRVSQSGWVLLFVNDEDVGNNSGGFEVRVVVTPPR